MTRILRTQTLRTMLLGGALLGLAACSGGAPKAGNEQAGDAPAGIGAGAQANALTGGPIRPGAMSAIPKPTPSGAQAPADSPAGPVACAAQIGQAAADRKAKLCRSVSPATHPPCNATNSCAMMDDEIARSCALFDGKGDPMPGCTPSPRSKEAAAAVVSRYYAALNARDYDTAWAQWGETGQPGQTRAKFEAGFARTRATTVTIGSIPPGDAGAGSLYQSIPVTVDATLADGTHQRFTGNYVVRRVNDVDGASPAQLRWHLDSAHLKAAR